MRIIPINKWIHVEPEKVEEESESLVLLPEDYKKADSHYGVFRIATSSGTHSVGDTIIVPSHVVQSIEVRGETIHLVQSNHIMAIVG